LLVNFENGKTSNGQYIGQYNKLSENKIEMKQLNTFLSNKIEIYEKLPLPQENYSKQYEFVVYIADCVKTRLVTTFEKNRQNLAAYFSHFPQIPIPVRLYCQFYS
jgi:hypothetical protein